MGREEEDRILTAAQERIEAKHAALGLPRQTTTKENGSMAGTKRDARTLARERVNGALKLLRKVRMAAPELDAQQRRDVIRAVQRELVSLDAVFAAPQDLFEFSEREELAAEALTSGEVHPAADRAVQALRAPSSNPNSPGYTPAWAEPIERAKS